MHAIRSRLDASASEQIGCKYCASRGAWAALAVRARGSDVGAGGTKCAPARVVCDAMCHGGTQQSQGRIHPIYVELHQDYD